MEAVEEELLFWTPKIINCHPTKTAVAKQVPPLESPAQGLPQGPGMQENKSWWPLNTGIFYKGILRLKVGISETQTWYLEIQNGHSETQNG